MIKYSNNKKVFLLIFLLFILNGCNFHQFNTGEQRTFVIGESCINPEGPAQTVVWETEYLCVPNDVIDILDSEEPFVRCGDKIYNNICHIYNQQFDCYSETIHKCVP